MSRFVKRTIEPNHGVDVSTPCRVVNRTDSPIDVVIFADQPTIEPAGFVPLKDSDQQDDSPRSVEDALETSTEPLST